MTLIRRLERRWLKDEALQRLEADQIKPIIDSLTLAMFADSETDATEEGALASVLMSLPSNFGEMIDYIDASRARAEALDGAEAMQAEAREIAAKIPEEIREQAFAMMAAMTIADRELKLSEAVVLLAFSEGLGFDEDKALAIYDEILASVGLSEA